MTPEELKAADEAFAALQAHVASLETTLQKYQTVLDFMFTNDTFFTNLTVQLEDRFLNVKVQVSTLGSLKDPVGRTELTHTLTTYCDNVLASMKAIIDVAPAKTTTSSNPKYEAPAVFSGKRED
jgi:hypothetical protein